jgi:transcriptional regulator with XRE-family HTH domain
LTENERKRIARSIRGELAKKFPDDGVNLPPACLAGISPATVSRWRDDAETPGIEQLVRLAATLDIPVHRLCGYSGKRPVLTKSAVFNIVMNLSIAGERFEDGRAGEAARAMLENAGRTLAGLLTRR